MFELHEANGRRERTALNRPVYAAFRVHLHGILDDNKNGRRRSATANSYTNSGEDLQAALLRELSRVLPERLRPAVEVRRVPRALVFDFRPVDLVERPCPLLLRFEVRLLRPRALADRRLEVPDAERRRDPLLERVVRVEARPRVERRVEPAVRPSERFFRSSCISFLSSAVSRLTSLLKLLCCPRAVLF